MIRTYQSSDQLIANIFINLIVFLHYYKISQLFLFQYIHVAVERYTMDAIPKIDQRLTILLLNFNSYFKKHLKQFFAFIFLT